MERRIVILPARNCRRSQKVLRFLQAAGIPFTRIDMETPEGQALAERYEMRASPGILVDGVRHNPLDLFVKPDCRLNEEAARALFAPAGRLHVDENDR